MKTTRKIIRIDEDKCNGCGLCVPSCAEGAIQIVDGKARLVADRYCDGLGACLGQCPLDALTVVDDEAEPFDEAAVHEHLKVLKEKKEAPPAFDRPGFVPKPEEAAPEPERLACGCPSAMVRSFEPATPTPCSDGETTPKTPLASELRHWPVQISLVPPTASFLKGANLLVAADCTPVAYPAFHRDLLKGKVVLMGCPKLDNTEAYLQKFVAIFEQADIKSITAVVMEVPCCRGLPMILQRAMALTGKEIPMETVVISTDGRMLDR